MDVGFIHTILTTTSLIFKTNIDNSEYCFYVESGNSKLDDGGNLTIKDCIADKTYFLPNSSFISQVEARDEVCPPYGQNIDYLSFKVQNRIKIANNNKIFKEEFRQIREFLADIDITEKNLYILKDKKPIKLIETMKHYESRDLEAFYEGGDKMAEILKQKCLSLVQETAKDAIEKLNIEREKFLSEGDSESVEEVDLIIEMIKQEVEATTFETLKTIDDIYTLWPSILLPVPF
jgi:hypothetical protein